MLKRNLLRSLLSVLEKIILVIQSVCLYASISTVIITVVLREVCRYSLIWGYEIACWFVILLLFLGMSVNLHHKKNLSVTFIYDISPALLKRIFSILHFLIEATVIAMMAVGYQIWITSVGSAVLPASGFTNVMYYGIISVGVTLSALELLAEILDLLVKKDPSDDAHADVHTSKGEEALT